VGSVPGSGHVQAVGGEAGGAGVDPRPDPRFGVVVCDPPWEFNNKGSRAAAVNHYNTVPSRFLHRLPVEDWCRDDAAIFLWTTDSHIKEALALMEFWDFNYKQVIPWIKMNGEGRVQIGMGNYFRHVSELCLFGTRGKVKVSRKDIPAVIFSPRTEHSTKPDAIYQLAEVAFPGVPMLEMFQRTARPGWIGWGNEAPRT
jgi:N6-adenosine-specific RNA methylase IME4